MKKIVLIGAVGSGKTTLCQRLNGLELQYHKTQTLQVVNGTIDTPGEYLEHRSLLRGLTVTAAESDLVVFVQDASQERFLYSPGQASAFPLPVIGVVTKIDLATNDQIAAATELLELAGAAPIFPLSSLTTQGLAPLLTYLSESPLTHSPEPNR